MRERRSRRVGDVDDPFDTIRFYLHADELAALDRWHAKTSLNRSEFVSALVAAELGLS